ncbi:MAG: lysoplasmalogenase [Emticicia sp.]|nr:lysoplasmalogenase [Emticicia sp.]
MTRNETVFYFILGIINIASGILDIEWLNFLSKPLLMITLFFFYFQKVKQNMSKTDKIILVSLIFSCLGDTFLMFQKQNSNFFLLGLGSFLVAQLAYYFIFSKSGKTQYLKRLPITIYTMALVAFLWNKIPKDFLLPIFVYAYAIMMMGIGAIQRQTNQKSYRFVLIGAILFIISDSLIAINKFAFLIPLSGLWVMSTYIAAQYLIVEGVLLGRNTK